MTTNTAGTNSLTCLPQHGGAQGNTFLVTHPITLLNFRYRTPKRTDSGATELLHKYICGKINYYKNLLFYNGSKNKHDHKHMSCQLQIIGMNLNPYLMLRIMLFIRPFLYLSDLPSHLYRIVSVVFIPHRIYFPMNCYEYININIVKSK
jgi:hypothetical protein